VGIALLTVRKDLMRRVTGFGAAARLWIALPGGVRRAGVRARRSDTLMELLIARNTARRMV